MSLLSPIWLLGLIPWAAVTAWLLRGRRQRVDVPFVQLWRGDVRGPRAKRSWERPPVALAAALVAMLLALLAAARPRVRVPGKGPTIAVVVDRGVKMSGTAAGGGAVRFRQLTHDVKPALLDQFGDVMVVRRFVPPFQMLNGKASNWTDEMDAVPPTAADTRELLRLAATDALRKVEGAVIVLSDQSPGIEDPRLVHVPPEKGVSNVGIVRFAMRETPAPQAMVRVRNQSSLSRAVLRLLSEEREVARIEVELPPSGDRDYFVDVPSPGKVVMAEVQVSDDLAADDRAWLVRERSWPVIQARSPLPAEVQRVIESYSEQRPATEGSRRISVATSVEAAGNDAAVILDLGAPKGASDGALQVTAHPLTNAVQAWPTTTPAPAPSGADWTPLVTRGGETLLAVRTDPVRQVWFGAHAADWAATTDFVILWTNIFDWLGEGGETFNAYPVAALGPEWNPVRPVAEPGLTPGLYRRADGALRAVNASDVRIPLPITTDWRSALAAAASTTLREHGTFSLSPALIILALTCLCVAAAAWARRPAGSSLTPFSAARTL